MSTTPRRKVIRFYRDAKGEYRWRLHAANGRVIAGPQEGYVKSGACERNALSVLNGTSLTRIGTQGEIRYGEVEGRDDVRVEWLPAEAPDAGADDA